LDSTTTRPPEGAHPCHRASCPSSSDSDKTSPTSWTPAAIEAACRQEGYTWRKRLLDPVVTIYLFLLQVLHGNTACQHVVQFGCWTFTDSAYCQARKRLPLRVFHQLLEWIARTGRRATASAHRWFGHRVWVLDGSSFSFC
jgi:hypothetical protein